MFAWFVTAASLVGMFLNVRRSRWCWVVWFVADACWVAIDIMFELWPQAVLMIIYAQVNIWGYIRWSEQANGRNGNGHGDIASKGDGH